MNKINILVRNGFVDVPFNKKDGKADQEALGSILMNLEYYGFALSPEAFRAISVLPRKDLVSWWETLETELKSITGDDRNIGDFVVYKNFPAEVLNKSEAEYWIPQILMYWGFPNDMFTEEVEPREGMDPSERKSKVLKLALPAVLFTIQNNLLAAGARWKQHEFDDVVFLAAQNPVDFSKIAFKENLVKLATYFIKAGIKVNVATATDVLRLGAGLSDGDISLREKVKFISFNRKSRRFLLSALEDCRNLNEDVARRAEVWKKFLHQLHAGDYKKSYPRVCKVMDDLYNDRLDTFNSKVEKMIAEKNSEVLLVLASRPGEFARRLIHMVDVFGAEAVNVFSETIPRLKILQIVSLRRMLEAANNRQTRMFPPKGNWARVQIGKPRPIAKTHARKLINKLRAELKKRVPKVSVLDERTADIKIATNGSDEGEFTRGTAFQIPEDVKFIRTASYWKQKSRHNVWYDNGWNFFNKDWGNMGACCWSFSNHNYRNGAAIFSGDPTNSKEMQGRAAQLIDLYPDKLVKAGVRYAVWNILCYSHIKFSEAEDVFAALQWGKDPQKGKLFEPSRCQISFPLKGEYFTKYVCLIDLEERKMVYLDANLKAQVHSADSNGDMLSEKMPAFMEYIDSLPSVHDLFAQSVDKRKGKGYVLYSDKDVEISEDEAAFIFQQENLNDNQKRIDINQILTS